MLDTAPNNRAVMGDNNPPADSALDTWKLCADSLHEAAEGFTEITNDAQAASVEAAIDEVKDALKGAAEAVKAGRKPHNDAANAVTASFKPILEKMTLTSTVVVNLMGDWRTKKEAERREEQARAAKIAVNKDAEARRLAAEADQTDTAALERVADAEREAKASKQDVKAVRSQKVASGGIRMVTVHDREIIDWDAALRHINAQDNPYLREHVDTWLGRAIRSGARDIPGVKITERKVPR